MQLSVIKRLFAGILWAICKTELAPEKESASYRFPG